MPRCRSGYMISIFPLRAAGGFNSRSRRPMRPAAVQAQGKPPLPSIRSCDAPPLAVRRPSAAHCASLATDSEQVLLMTPFTDLALLEPLQPPLAPAAYPHPPPDRPSLA